MLHITPHSTYHEGVIERGKDMRDSEIFLTLGNLRGQSHNFLHSLFFLFVSLQSHTTDKSEHTAQSPSRQNHISLSLTILL